MLSLGGAALLVLALAWMLGRDPDLAGQASALRDADALRSAMEARAAGLTDALRRGEGPLAPILAARFDADARLLSPRPLPPGRELRDEVEREGEGSLSEGASWLAEARRLAGPRETREASLAAADRGLAAALAGEARTRAELELLRAQLLSELERFDDAAETLRALWQRTRANETMDGVSVRLVCGNRLARARSAAGEEESARQVMGELLSDLTSGRLPLQPSRLAVEAQILERELQPESAPSDYRALATHFRWAGLVHEALLPGVDRSALPVADAWLLSVPGASSAYLYAGAALRETLAQTWREMLPDSEALALVAPGVSTRLTVLAAPAPPRGFGSGWRIVLALPNAYREPAAQRRTLVAAGSLAFLGALVIVGWFGSRALRRREELERLRSDFVAGVSHELRTPAASLALLAENLAEGRIRDPERQKEYFSAMQRDAARLQRLVADVLDFSRWERGAYEIRRTPTDLRVLLCDLAEEELPRLADAGMELALEVGDDLPRATEIDGEAVERAVANLLENSRKYAAEGGQATLRATVDGADVVIEVEDRGPGVPVAWRERVFDAYERSPEGQQHAAGAGLGLTLVRATAQAHGGSVAVAAGSGGRGARFSLRLPCEPASESESEGHGT